MRQLTIVLIVYDNESHIHWFPLGLAYIASSLQMAGHYVVIYHQDICHSGEAELKDFIEHLGPDIVATGAISGYWQHKQLFNISLAINACENRRNFLYVIGGHGPSPEPVYFSDMTDCDVVCLGEAEETMVEVAECYASGNQIQGILGTYSRGWYNRPRRPNRDLDLLPPPAYDLFKTDVYRLLRMPHAKPTDFVMPALTGRGCPYACTFCYRMTPGYRLLSLKTIARDLDILTRYPINATYIAFADELLMHSRKRTLDLCDVIGRFNVKWSCNGRLNSVDPEVIDAMHQAGCVFINYGIESMDDTVLEAMKKKLTRRQVERGVSLTLEHGISPGLNIIWGNIGDTEASLKDGVKFIKDNSDTAQLRTIRPVTPYPGSELYRTAINKGLIGGAFDFYCKHTNSDLFTVNFMGMSNQKAHSLLLEANSELIEFYYTKKRKESEEAAKRLYRENDATFRGFRTT